MNEIIKTLLVGNLDHHQRETMVFSMHETVLESKNNEGPIT